MDEIVPALTEALRDPDPDLRILALKILEYIEQKVEPALPTMIKALEDDHRTVRICALAPVASFSHVSAVGHILMIDPTRSEELLPVLLKSLNSDDFGIRCQTAWLLGQLGELGKEAMPELERMLDDDDSSVRCVAQF